MEKTIKVRVCDKELVIKRLRSVAIKAKCTDCSVGQRLEVLKCPCEDCPLWTFRGYIIWDRERRKLSDEEKRALSERLSLIRGRKKGF